MYETRIKQRIARKEKMKLTLMAVNIPRLTYHRA